MPEETRGLDARYQTLIRDVLQQKKRAILPYIIWEGRVLSQRDFVTMALETLHNTSPALELVVILQYRLDEPEKAETFSQRTSTEIKRKARTNLPKNVNMQAGIKALRSLEISPPFAAFLVPTPEEISQLKEALKNTTAQLEETRQARDTLFAELKDTRVRLTDEEREKQTLQAQIEQLQNSRLSNRIRRVFSRSKAAPA